MALLAANVDIAGEVLTFGVKLQGGTADNDKTPTPVLEQTGDAPHEEEAFFESVSRIHDADMGDERPWGKVRSHSSATPGFPAVVGY